MYNAFFFPSKSLFKATEVPTSNGTDTREQGAIAVMLPAPNAPRNAKSELLSKRAKIVSCNTLAVH